MLGYSSTSKVSFVGLIQKYLLLQKQSFGLSLFQFSFFSYVRNFAIKLQKRNVLRLQRLVNHYVWFDTISFKSLFSISNLNIFLCEILIGVGFFSLTFSIQNIHAYFIVLSLLSIKDKLFYPLLDIVSSICKSNKYILDLILYPFRCRQLVGYYYQLLFCSSQFLSFTKF